MAHAETAYVETAHLDAFAGPGAGSRDHAVPSIRRLGTRDLTDALRAGFADFKANPSHLVFIALIYPIAGLLLARLTVSYDVLPLLFPLAAGFALIGPFAALGIYEISRRREAGLDYSWQHAFDAFGSRRIGSILLVGGLLCALFLLWLGSAWAIYRSLFGMEPVTSPSTFLGTVLTTPRGWALILVGNAVGFIFALAALCLSVVSFPMLLDRDVDGPTAVRTSIAAVRQNPRIMLRWGAIVAGLLILGSLPVLVGLVVVMPVLGHATWHLYRRAVGDGLTLRTTRR